jgi:hypothetical protein
MIVYWCAYTEFDTISSFKFSEPEAVSKIVNSNFQNLEGGNDFRTCPASRDYFKNVYELKFPCDYTLVINTNKQLLTNDYDQDYFNQMVVMRSTEYNLYAYNLRYLFLAEDDLELSQESAHFSNTEFSKNTMFVPGKVNIGKWFRALDCGFIIRNDVDKLEMIEGQPYSYIRFHTEEKIIFKRYHRTEKIKKLQAELAGLRFYRTKKIYRLAFFYDIFKKLKIKSLILKEIKENLMD